MRRLLLICFFAVLGCPLLLTQSYYPVPREVRMMYGKKTLNLSKGIALSDPEGVVDDESFFLKVRNKGVPFIVDCGDVATGDRQGLNPTPGAYKLDVNPKGITISANDKAGVFYALQTLRQLLDESEGMRVPCCVIEDWPETTDRGLFDGNLEGSWSHELRLSMIELASNLKMGTYVYAPKDDPYVGSPDWYMPYPQGRSENLKELIELCSSRSMEFVWCIRPDNDFTWSEDDCNLLLGKLELMHYLGVRSFGVILDDVPCHEGDETRKQDLIDRINTEFIAKKKGLKPVMTSFDSLYSPAVGGESAKLGMYGYACRTWSPDSFDPEKCLEIAVGQIAPDAVSAYRTYALHSDVCVDAFGMEESGSLKLIGLEGYNQEEYDQLMSEFKKMERVSAEMSASSNSSLYADMKPWLDQFVGLGERCRRILECISHLKQGDVPSFWSTYASNLMSAEDKEAFEAHSAGTIRLQPYYETMMNELAAAADMSDKGKLGYTYQCIEGVDVYMAPDEAVLCHLILNNPEGREVIVRLSDVSGRYTAEFCIETSYFQFEMKDDAVKVEVIGDVDVFEAVFVK